MPQISVVIVALNEGKNLRRTVDSFQSTLPAGSEIVVIDDGSDDGSPDFLTAPGSPARLLRTNHVGVANARNLGARRTSGDILVFSDAHITMSPGWWKPMVKVLAKKKVGGVAPVIVDVRDTECKGFGLRLTGPNPAESWLPRPGDQPCEVPLLPWCSSAMRRDTFEATGGFDGGMICWGSIDNEMSLRLSLLGYQLWIVPRVEALHLFRIKRPYPVEWSWFIHNKLRMSFVHFGAPRIARVVDALRSHEDFPAAMALLAQGNVTARRAELAARRRHDDEWYFQKFGPDW